MSSSNSSSNNTSPASCPILPPPPPPTNPLVTALLTDLYQITMTYAYWKNNRHKEHAVFELFFRTNPFGGAYTIFAGRQECLQFVAHFGFSASDISYLQSLPGLAHFDTAFWEWLGEIDASDMRLWSLPEGSVCFPRVPLIIVEGPLAVGQLLETTLLTLVNYPSLVATNASRMVAAATSDDRVRTQSDIPNIPPQCLRTPRCIEFGLRRAQGPDGGFSASKYAWMGGFAATSNVQAGRQLGIPVAGTHAHAFVQTFGSLDDLPANLMLPHKTQAGVELPIVQQVVAYRQQLAATANPAYGTTHIGELAAFIAYAVAFPDACLCLIDTYDTLTSGLLNYSLVALVLDDAGYTPRGVRLDSGDLGMLSLACARHFQSLQRAFADQLDIVASNDINEAALYKLNQQLHAITAYGIGTHLVTCQAQPALGGVYKLVQVNGQARIKLSQDIAKVLIPGRKRAYRLWGKDNLPLMDVLIRVDDGNENNNNKNIADPIPTPGTRMVCRHPFVEGKRAAVTPTRVQALHELVYDCGTVVLPVLESTTSDNSSTSDDNSTTTTVVDPALAQAQATAREGLARLPLDIRTSKQHYKVAVTEGLYTFLHEFWQQESPLTELE